MINRTATPAVFLDRDGVLVRDANLLTRAEDICIYPAVPRALRRLKEAGYRLLVVSNQPVIARGLLSPGHVVALQAEVERQLARAGSPPLDGFYFCPHHPDANLPVYRMDCECRKPRPGLLIRAAGEHAIDLSASFMVGDRLSDIAAGAILGCRTALVTTGAHCEPPIVTPEPTLPDVVCPDLTCGGLEDVASWILGSA